MYVSIFKGRLSTILTIAFSAANAAGMAVLACWFIFEKWRLSKSYGLPGEHLMKDSLSIIAFGWLMEIFNIFCWRRDPREDLEANTQNGGRTPVHGFPFIAQSPQNRPTAANAYGTNIPGASLWLGGYPVYQIRRDLF